MSLRKLFFSIWPHKCVFGRGRARELTEIIDVLYDADNAPLTRIKTCRLCGHTKPVRARRPNVVPEDGIR
jgi:hypothetical protein